MTPPASSPSDVEEVPIFQESLAGSLIDAARITVMAAITMLPEAPRSLIIVPGIESQQDPAETAQGCLEQAMMWLDQARGITIANGAPVTSLHVANAGRDRSGIGPDDDPSRR